MRAARRLPAAAALAAAALPCASAGATPSEPDYVPGEVLMGFEDGTAAAVRADALRAQGLPVPGDLGRREALRLRVEDGRLAGRSVPEVAAALSREPGVRYAEPNWRYRVQIVPNDPGFGALWGLQSTRATAAWDITTGTPGVTVAVVDTGVAYGHPDLAPNLVGGWDFVGASWPSCAGGDPDASDGEGHGTHVAGILGARGNDGTGVPGVAWGARIMPVRALGADGAGSSASVACAFAYAGRMGARIVNASLGGPGYSQAIADAVAGAPQTLFVVAAGNDAVDVDASPEYPCALPSPQVICVAATDQADGLASFSNTGATSVDLGAPGDHILSDDAAHAVVANLPPGPSWTPGGAPPWAVETVAGQGATLSDSPGGAFYPPNANGYADSPAFGLAGRRGCRLAYRLRLDARSGDLLWVETSTDGAAWTAVDQLSGSTQGAFAPQVADLSSLEGAPSAQVSFRLTSNAAVEGDGANVAAPRVECLPTAYTGQELRLASGTSMAAPHVAGAAALLLSKDPTLSPVQVKTRLLATVHPLPALAGRTVSGGRLDVRAALESDAGAGAGTGLAVPVPDAPPEPVAVRPFVGDRLAPRILRLVVRPGRGRIVLSFRLDERATVTAEARATRRRSRVVRRVTRLAPGQRRVVIAHLAAGRYRVRLTAGDAAGNRRAVARQVTVRGR